MWKPISHVTVYAYTFYPTCRRTKFVRVINATATSCTIPVKDLLIPAKVWNSFYIMPSLIGAAIYITGGKILIQTFAIPFNTSQVIRNKGFTSVMQFKDPITVSHIPEPSSRPRRCAIIEVTVCPYTFISIILCSFMIECRDLALNHPLAVGGSWDSFEPNGTGLTSLQSLPPFWA